MLRGKMINALSNPDSKLLKNEEIQLLFQALGITPHHYDPSDLRYGRVAICSDQDSDGLHVGLLVAAALLHFCPQFIKEGRLCWLRSPLYIVKKKGSEDKYYFTDNDIDAAKASGEVSGEVQRNKGLGSMSSAQAKDSMFGTKQHLDVLIPDEDSVRLLVELMGDDITPRKRFIMNEIDFSEVRE